jgi:hypothetical protein
MLAPTGHLLRVANGSATAYKILFSSCKAPLGRERVSVYVIAQTFWSNWPKSSSARQFISLRAGSLPETTDPCECISQSYESARLASSFSFRITVREVFCEIRRGGCASALDNGRALCESQMCFKCHHTQTLHAPSQKGHTRTCGL